MNSQTLKLFLTLKNLNWAAEDTNKYEKETYLTDTYSTVSYLQDIISVWSVFLLLHFGKYQNLCKRFCVSIKYFQLEID